MKINPKINKRVKDSVAECRKCLTDATIELLKMIAEPGQDVVFDKILILHQERSGMTETVLANRIAYCTGRGDSEFYILGMGEDGTASNMFLSLSNLQTIYNDVRKVVREE